MHTGGKRPQSSAANAPAGSRLSAKKRAFAKLLTDMKRASRYASRRADWEVVCADETALEITLLDHHTCARTRRHAFTLVSSPSPLVHPIPIFHPPPAAHPCLRHLDREQYAQLRRATENAASFVAPFWAPPDLDSGSESDTLKGRLFTVVLQLHLDTIEGAQVRYHVPPFAGTHDWPQKMLTLTVFSIIL